MNEPAAQRQTDGESGSRYVMLDGLRGICAIGIMTHHYSTYYTYPTLWNVAAGVDLFFMLSGFVLSHAYGAKILAQEISFAAFMTKRLIRLYPMLLAGLFLGVVSLYALSALGHGSYGPQAIAAALAHNLFFLPYLNAESAHFFEGAVRSVGIVTPLDGASWALFFELLANLFLFFLVRQSPQRLLAIALLACAATLISAALLAHAEHFIGVDCNGGWSTDNFAQGFPRVAMDFTLGVLIHKRVAQRQAAGAAPFFPSRWPMILYALLIAALMTPVFLNGTLLPLIVTLFCPFLLFASALATPASVFVRRLAKFLGTISFPLACLHVPLGNLVAIALNEGGVAAWLPIPFILLASLVSALVSLIAVKYYETPLRAFLSQRADFLYKRRGNPPC